MCQKKRYIYEGVLKGALLWYTKKRMIFKKKCMLTRQKKQVIYIIFFFILFLGILGGGIRVFSPHPTCTDGIKNQGEEDIDCGGSCLPCSEVIEAEDIKVIETALLPVSSNVYDAVAFIQNPNNLFGSGNITYTFEFIDGEGVVLKTLKGTAYILPAQGRYLMLLEERVENFPVRVEFRIDSIVWEKFSEYEAPSLTITNKTFEKVSSGTDYGVAKGLVRNQSPYDFETVEIYVVLRNTLGEIIAINRTDMQTVRAGEKRDFPVTWKYIFDGDVSSIDAQAITNMFGNQNFIKLFFPGGRFQQYK